MKIKTSYCCHAPAGHEWSAYDDDRHPDGPQGDGGTEIDALVDLYWMVDGETETAVKAKMDEVENA